MVHLVKLWKRITASKLQKTSRSILKVDFGEQGVRYVNKKVLQLVGSFEENQDYVLDTTDKEEFRVNVMIRRKKYKESYDQQNMLISLKIGKKNKEFREWRKDHLDEKQIDIQNAINELRIFSLNINRRKKLGRN